MSTGGPTDRSYAGARMRVVPNSRRTFLEERATATKRWTREETQSRMADAPPFRHPSPAASLLGDLRAGYQHITGDAVMRPAKVNLIAACYRVHGDDFLPLVAHRFASTGTVTNLLGEIRCLPPREPPAPDVQAEAEPMEPEAEPSADRLPDPEDPGPEPNPFDPETGRRSDRGPSNTDPPGSSDQLAIWPSSPTARALAR